MSLFSGVFVANITPFAAKGGIDLDLLESHLGFLESKGVHGFVPCGTTGEGALLTASERRQVLEHTLRFARGKGMRVIAGCGSNCTATALEMIREARELGCDAALVVTPYYVKPGPEGLLAHYRHLADEGGLPLILYNVPSRTNLHLSVELTAELLGHSSITGIKEASGQYGHWLALSRALDLKSRSFLAGDDDGFAAVLALGGSGIISASANVAPESFVALYEHARAGHWAEAFQLQKELYPLTHALFMETNPAPVKFALEHLGYGKFPLRLPLVSVSGPTREAIVRALSRREVHA